MKKNIFTLIAVLFLLTACGDSGDNNKTKENNQTQTTSQTPNNSNNQNQSLRQSFSMILDVEEIKTSTNWKKALGINDNNANFSLSHDGKYGEFTIKGDRLEYIKKVDTNKTDIGKFTLDLSNGNSKVVGVRVESLYWKDARCGAHYTIALKSDGTIWGWGYNKNGELGDGTTTNRLNKVQEITHSHDWAKIDAGGWTTYAIKKDGSLWAWGHNDLGQLGDGSNIFSHNKATKPIKISDKIWKEISSRNSHVLALQIDDSLWSWGSNVGGCIGNGNTDIQLTPYHIKGKWLSISAGENFSVALKDDKNIYSWGDNTLGELGVGDKTDRLTPTIVKPSMGNLKAWHFAKFTQISAGDSHVLVIGKNGDIWGWGHNGFSQLTNSQWGGDEKLVPIKINLPSIKYISAGAEYSMAIYSDNTLWGWGDSQYGNLGADTWNVNIKLPIQESTKSNHWIKVDAGVVHSVAIDNIGRLWIWGTNEYGELGDGTTTSSATPKKIYNRNL